MTRTIHADFVFLTPEELRTQAFWAYTVRLTDYEKIVGHMNNPSYDCDIEFLYLDLL